MTSRIEAKLLKDVTYEQFKEFLDSLDEERKTWSLDLQGHFKTDKEFYEVKKEFVAIVCVDGEKVIGLCDYYEHPGSICEVVVEVSFVVKKEYQGKSIGTKMLLTLEALMKDIKYEYITAKHYKDNIASHKAFLKAGYEEWVIGKKYYCHNKSAWFNRDKEENENIEWKIKQIG